MRAGIFARTFVRPTVEEVFGTIAGLGLRCVQFNFACAGLPSLPNSVEPEMLERIRRAADQQGIAIAALSGTFNAIHPDPGARHDGLKRLEVVAASCRRLGCAVVTLCTGTRDAADLWRRHPDNDAPEAWRDLLATLTAALGIAERHAVILGIEPETGNVIDSASKARRLLDELASPRLKIILDAANLLHPDDLPRMREILKEAVGLLGEDIVLAHAKELSGKGHAGNLTPGQGVLDWDFHLSLLDRAGFDGPLILHGFDESQAATAVGFLRQKGVRF